MIYFFVGALLGLAVGYYIVNRRRKPATPLTCFEYWVFIPGEEMPPQDEILRVTMLDTHLTTREGLLFSDIRLHISLVLKAKNAHAFRPDLFDRHITPTEETLAGLAKAKAFIKLRYLSEIPLPDRRHIVFMPRLAATVCELGNGLVVFDVIQEKLFAKTDFLNETTFRVIWIEGPSAGHVETRGLIKIGIPEIVTEEISPDQRTLALEVIELAAQKLWQGQASLDDLAVECFDDTFKIEIGPKTRILRLQASGGS